MGMSRNKVLRLGAWAVLLLLNCTTMNGVWADTESDKVVGLKAALIFRSSTFVTWPKDTFNGQDTPLLIGVLGNESIRNTLADVTTDVTIVGHPIEVINVTLEDDWSLLHIIFVDSSMTEAFLKIDKDAHIDTPLLTLGDSTKFAESGGIMQIFIDNNKPRIRVNIDAAERKKLKINSRLLELADVVRDK